MMMWMPSDPEVFGKRRGCPAFPAHRAASKRHPAPVLKGAPGIGSRSSATWPTSSMLRETGEPRVLGDHCELRHIEQRLEPSTN